MKAMMLWSAIIFLNLIEFIGRINGDHFRGGIISWRPLNNVPNGTTVQVQIHQRYFWNRQWAGYSTRCTEANIVSKTPIPVNDEIYCYVNCVSSTFPSAGLSTVVTSTDCDQSTIVRAWAGEKYDTITLPLTTFITIGYTSAAWFGPNLYPAAGGYWSLANRVNLVVRPDGYINTSPVTNTLPVLFKPVGQQLVHVVQMSDNDGTDILKCRWANANSGTNFNRRDECEDACNGLNGISTLYPDNCTIVFTLPTNRINWYYVIALQIEDYYDASSTTPMSSVPIQFLFYAYSPSGSCTTRPQIIGDRPNRACIGTPINVTITERVVAQTSCSGSNITNFVTSSPIGMQHSTISNLGSGVFVMTLTWTPEARQYGPQGFCAGAVDNNNLQSDAWCITYLVGFESPNLIRTRMVQGSASPIGTIFSNHSIFSIQATRNVSRPTRNGTYIRFMDATTSTSVQVFDAGWQTNLIYTANTIIIVTNYAWIPGRTYYVLFDSGVASGTEFCGPESAPITDTTFWNFNIWDPGLSSTTSSTTTPPTTGTVVTRPMLTTTVNPGLTTTGIIATTPSTVTTTTSQSSTSTLTTTVTTTTTSSVVTTSAEMSIMYPKDMEEACRQPVAIMTMAVNAAFVPIHCIGMFMMFTKMVKTFGAQYISAHVRHQARMRRLGRM